MCAIVIIAALIAVTLGVVRRSTPPETRGCRAICPDDLDPGGPEALSGTEWPARQGDRYAAEAVARIVQRAQEPRPGRALALRPTALEPKHQLVINR